MIELHLIGYTEDREYLVLDLDEDGDGSYRVRMDPDLFATLEQLRADRVARGAPVDLRVRPAPPSSDGQAPARRPSRITWPSAPEHAEVARPPTGGEDLAAEASAVEEPADEGDAAVDDVPADQPIRGRLTPAEIQQRLRAGRSPRAVAKEAETDLAWIERWLPPILGERDRVLADALGRRLDVPRARPLGAAVDRTLADRDVAPTSVAWSVARRDDGRWGVTVRFEERERSRSATWLLDPEAGHLHPASQLATELASPARARRRR